MPKYFGYEKYIIKELEKRGAHVDLIFENLFDINTIYRFIRVFSTEFVNFLFYHYYMKKIQQIELDLLDSIIVIRGSTLTEPILEFLEENTKKSCKFIMYQWDSISNNPNALLIADYFDKILTFDPSDALKYSWIYRPLFYIPSLCNNENKKYIDVLYICSLHSKRLKILEKLKKYCEVNKLHIKYSVYAKPIIYIKFRFFDGKPDYKGTCFRDLSFKSLSLEETYKLYSSSKCVVDFAHPNQKGLTMRSIESVFSGCKLYTNNTTVVESDFYDKNNINVYEDVFIDLDLSFIFEPIHELNANLCDYYSLNHWIDDVFEI